MPNSDFHLVFAIFETEEVHSLALTALSAYVKQEILNVRVTLVSIHKGDEATDFTESIKGLEPDLIAVTAMYPTWLPLDSYLRIFKQQLPLTPIVVGGHQAMLTPEATISHPAVDFVCLGDGEKPLVNLIQRIIDVGDLKEPISGLWIKTKSGDIVKSPPVFNLNLNDYPFPDYSIYERDGRFDWLNQHALESKKLNTLSVMTGKGCPHRCTYCGNISILKLFGNVKQYLRKYEPGRVTEELVRLRDRYKVDYFQFLDETFSWDRPYAFQILERYKKRVDRPFSMLARPENMDDEFCKFAVSAGCHTVFFGVECGSEEFRKRWLHRSLTNRQIIKASENARKYGIRRVTYNMVGLPHETADNIRETVEFSKYLDPEMAIFIQFLPMPGTPLWELCEKEGLLVEPSEEHQMTNLGKLNIKESPGCVSPSEMTTLATEILDYVGTTARFDD